MVYVVAHAKHLRKHDQETEGIDFSVWINTQTSGTPNKLSELPPPRLKQTYLIITQRKLTPPKKKHWKYKNINNGSRARKNIFLSITFLEHTDVFCVNTATGLVCLLILHSIKLIRNQNWEALLVK